MAKAQTKTGIGAIRDAWVNSQRRLEEAAKEHVFVDPNAPREGIKPGQWDGAPYDRMPPGCPVHVIGRDAEGTVWCRNTTGDLVSIAKWDMATISKLFAPQLDYAHWAWPAFGKTKITDPTTGEVREILEVKRIERDKLFMCLDTAAGRRDLFDPDKQHRGRGGWTDTRDQFIWHSGKYLWRLIGGRLVHVPPSEHDGFLYTRQPNTVEPWDGPVAAAESPARRILAELCTWNWERPYLDPVLCLGWAVTALMGGALKARPVVFTTGGAGVGKSTLHDLLGHLLEGVVKRTVDTTAAGVYQAMKHDALPLMIDELESKAGSTKAETVIELARVAYSGGEIGRGGNDHNAVSFTMRSSFFFSAINPPPMKTQDKTRMAMLNLARLDKASAQNRKVLVRSDVDGRMILRQIMDGWEIFQKRLLPDWWTVLAGRGLDSRAIDTYGTLLAAAELVVGPDALEDVGLPITEAQKLGEVIEAATAVDRAEQLENWHKCINHLLACTIDAWRDGARPTIGGVLGDLKRGGLDMDVQWARARLELCNLGVRNRGDMGEPSQGPYLAVPADGPQLTKLFAQTDWHSGVWFTSLKQAPPQIVLRGRDKTVVKINDVARRCLLIDMTAFGKHAEEM